MSHSKSYQVTNKAQPWKEMNSGVIRQAIDDSDLGSVTLSPKGMYEAGTYASFKLVYTAGKFGIDDSGGLRVCFRFASDQGNPQFENPQATNYTVVKASNGALLNVSFSPKGNVRPWDRTIYIKVVKGFLAEGETISIYFGEKQFGSPGMRLQTFCEKTFEFRVLVDPIATYNFQTLPEQPVISIIPGEYERFVLVLPTHRRVDEAFNLKIKAEDKWGNPTYLCQQRFKLKANVTVHNLPVYIQFIEGQKTYVIDNLSVSEINDVCISLVDSNDNEIAISPILCIDDSTEVQYWGDLHGQSEETIGTGSAEEYFVFARDYAFVDICGHQGNDFQITNEFWQALNNITREFNQNGHFITIPGYEWSGNTALGGDRNVFFPEENRIIRRSSHALIEDKSDIHTDCFDARALFEALNSEKENDVICFAHCGGRYADIAYAHDGRFETSIEIHSSWGTFEWLLHDALDLGYRVGVVANSDGHKGRPGASYPGAGKFGAIGGLTSFIMPELTRESLFRCLKKRRHYGTTGGPNGRIYIELHALFSQAVEVFNDDPKLFDTQSYLSKTAKMGDIVKTSLLELELKIKVKSTNPIERIEIFNGSDIITTIRPYDESNLGNRIRLHWEGAEYRGRFRQVIWDGEAKVSDNKISHFSAINFFNKDKTLTRTNHQMVAWQAVTTGNFAGCDLQLQDKMKGQLMVQTPLINFEIDIKDIGINDIIYDNSATLPRFFKVYRLPNLNNSNLNRVIEKKIKIKCNQNNAKDDAIYLRVTCENGTRAWTSPVYIFNKEKEQIEKEL